MQLTRARVKGWLIVVAAFVGVWFGAKSMGILFATIAGLLPLQFLVSREVLRERRYPTWFAGFALLFGPMGMLVVLALPKLPGGESELARTSPPRPDG